MFIHRIDEQLSLRMFTEQDTEELYLLTMASKQHLQQWLSWLNHVHTIEDTLHHIRGTLQSFANNGGTPTNFAIVFNSRIVGTIGFNAINQMHKSASIGYWIAKSHEGKGLVSKSFHTLLSFGFNELDLNRIEVRVAEGNKKSRAIPERFGFVSEGKLREAEWLYDHYVDHIVYSLLKSEWKNMQI